MEQGSGSGTSTGGEGLNIRERARHFLAMEARAIQTLVDHVGSEFEAAVDLVVNCKGRVITTGMGKAGLIARKVAATLSSTGTPSVFLHPAEAIHGDLGMVTAQDVCLAFSNRGTTDEVLRILPFMAYRQVPVVAFTSNGESQLARHAEVVLLLHVTEEACPLNLAPTSSTTAMLALGDTLAMVVLEARGFEAEDYAVLHPGGSLGRRLLTKVSDLMHTGDDNPVVPEETPLREAVVVMTAKKLAAISVTGPGGRLAGFFVTGDLGRLLTGGTCDLDQPVRNVMTRNPKTVWPDMMAVKALEILREHKIIQLPVVDDEHRPIGMIHLHDITRVGIT